MKPDKKEIEKLASIDLKKDVKRKGERKAEENVKIKLIVPLLGLLAYDAADDIVEERKRAGKTAIAVRLDRKPCVYIECEGPGAELDSQQQQAFHYAFLEGFLYLVLTNGTEIRAYRTWEASADVESCLLFASKLEALPETFCGEKGIWNLLSRDSVTRTSDLIDTWKEFQAQAPMAVSYVDGLFDDASIAPEKATLLEKAFRYAANHQHSKSIDSFRDCLSLELTDSEKAALHAQIGLCLYHQGRLAEARDSFNEGLSVSRKQNDTQGICACLGNIALVLSRIGELDEAVEHLQESLETHREIGNRLGEAQVIGHMGLIYRAKGELDDALRHHQEALKIHREIGYRRGEAGDLGNIGLVCAARDELDDALEHHLEALKIDKEIKNEQGEAGDLGNIGLVYKTKGDLDNALKYLTGALEIFDAVSPGMSMQTLNNIAAVHFLNGCSREGFEFSAKALASSFSSDQFNDAFTGILLVIARMISDGDWQNLRSIESAYTSGNIQDESFIDFFKCLHQFALYRATSEELHREAYEHTRNKLEPRLREIVDGLTEEED